MRHHSRYTLLFTVVRTGVTLARSSNSSSISWIKPGSGDIFGPGDTLAAEWTTDDKVVSPSFQLCSDDGCGEAVWPDVQQSNGSYSVSVYVTIISLISG
jgi:hypothetical protein